MIVFDRLWETMKEKNISQYKLINTYGVSPGQITRLKRNSNINTYTLNRLCKILDCGIEDIMEYKKE
ncbi:MAG: helix-turn-helix transcriptional regulator [Firmicutes bacterium]|jgi:putative transcriptional regulator|nr:helix-turn-helix transcriptional regulator [Bacillota bacterium]NBI63332.1 XRE family transcriptional regulator [Clostridiales bacterium]